MQGGIKLTYALVIFCHMLTKLMKGLKMSTSNIQNDKNKKLNQKYTVKNALVNYYLFLMFINIIVLILLLFYNDLHFLDMQVAKSQFHINYLFYSFISIITFTYLKDKIKLKKTPLHWVGKNAISFYFCQGIGSSLIYYLYKYIKNWHGIIKLPIMFTANLIITIILVLILNILIKIITKIKPINLIVKKD